MRKESRVADLFEAASSAPTTKLDVVKLDYIGSESLSWRELFEGFESIKAITFSSGVGFVYRLLDMFADAEVIFGCEEVMSYALQDVMAYQSNLIDRIRDGDSAAKQRLINRVERGDVHLFVAHTRLSHEKVYLLRAPDGRKRVVMGSANLSFNAFGGRQRENICYIDGDAAYDRYLESYEELKRDCVDEITKKALMDADMADNIDLLPIAETVKVKKIGTAFYREYLRRMLAVVPDLMDRLKDDSPEAESPDILAESSRVIKAIIAGHADKLPPYAAELSLENYFSEQVTGKYAIQTIQTAWRANPKAFEVNERTNIVRYEAGENWDADRLMKELPETLCARRSRDSVIMDLDAARQFFGVDFKSPTLLNRLLGRH